MFRCCEAKGSTQDLSLLGTACLGCPAPPPHLRMVRGRKGAKGREASPGTKNPDTPEGKIKHPIRMRVRQGRSAGWEEGRPRRSGAQDADPFLVPKISVGAQRCGGETDAPMRGAPGMRPAGRCGGGEGTSGGDREYGHAAQRHGGA